MIKLTIQQVILVLLAAFFIIDRFIKFIRREQTQSLVKFVGTVIIWLLVLVIAIFPTSTKAVLRVIGIGQRLDSLVFAGFVIVLASIFKLLNIIEKLERHITEIVRREALRELKK
jgi:hypothetical protein